MEVSVSAAEAVNVTVTNSPCHRHVINLHTRKSWHQARALPKQKYKQTASKTAKQQRA